MSIETKWWKESVVYQIYPKSFCDSNGDGIGDIEGIISKLDYLAWLGVDIIWLSPIYPGPGFDNGYDISDYRDIASQFGTIADFDRLLEKAHGKGLRVILDLVVNHSSDEHPWFIESSSSKDDPKRDYYIWRDGNNEGKYDGRPNNWGSFFGGPAWTKTSGSDQYCLHLFSAKQPDLNWENDTLRREIYDMMCWWLDKGVDGFRMDVISLISKVPEFHDGIVRNDGYGDPAPFAVNGPKVHDYLKEMRREVLSRYDIMTVGEASGATIAESKKYASRTGDELDMIFHFEHNDLDGGESFKWNDRKIELRALKRTLDRWQTELDGVAWNSLYWNNHDQPRIVSRLGDMGVYRERSAAMLATCLHMMQGTPYIYQGEELGMTNMTFTSVDQLQDPESIQAYEQYTGNGRFTAEQMMSYISAKSRDNARTPMQWNASTGAGFTSGIPWMEINPNYPEINAEEQWQREDSTLQYYRRLIAVRKSNPIAVYGGYIPVAQEHPDVYAYIRSFDRADLGAQPENSTTAVPCERLFVACNFRTERVYFALPQEVEDAINAQNALGAQTQAIATSLETLIGNVSGSHYTDDFVLEPYEAIVLRYWISKRE